MSSESSDDDFFLQESTFLKLKRKRKAVHDINLKKTEFGEYHHLFQDLKQDAGKFFDYTRMTVETFNYILKKIEHRLTKAWCNWHTQPILPEERLVITLR